jgi:hypothetical protein
MFGISTDEQISEELLTSYQAWDQYIAVIWASLLGHCQLSREAVVVEIAPGSSPKIAYALQKLDFAGEVYLVEPYEKALHLVTEKYRAILPHAVIYPLKHLLIESINKLPQFVDCVIAHHPLDDMIVGLGVAQDVFKQLFSWVCEDKLAVQAIFADSWQQLVQQPTKLCAILQEIIEQWLCIIRQVRPRLLMISQYPSLVLQTPTMESLNRCAQSLLQHLKEHLSLHLLADASLQALLNNNNNYNFALIANEVLNAKNWLIYRKETLR